MTLKTGFVKVAQSGPTIDGRKIDPQWLLDAAEMYDKSLYTALVYPDHNEYGLSYGTVEALSARKSGDMVELFADISPNTFWQEDVKFGQNAFTSIAILPNFAGTGKHYMYSLAATNNPASLGVEQLKFSKNHQTALFSAAIESTAAKPEESILSDSEIIGFFRKLLKLSPLKEPEQMASEEYKELAAKFAALEKEHADLKGQIAQGSGQASGTDDVSAKFAAMEKDNADLKAKLEAAEKFNSELSGRIEAYGEELSEYKSKLDEALKEVPASTGSKKEFGAAPKDDTVYA